MTTSRARGHWEIIFTPALPLVVSSLINSLNPSTYRTRISSKTILLRDNIAAYPEGVGDGHLECW